MRKMTRRKDDEEYIEVPAKDVNETTAGRTVSTTHVEKKEQVSITAAFIANVLEALPNMENPQSVVDEDCLSLQLPRWSLLSIQFLSFPHDQEEEERLVLEM
jgi:hypothetical protein